ncbi:aminoacyl-tRNA hydrolase [Falsigemmobacter faecalis]|uniref:Peptidyl-tRNA hydrolase n=1 Tax=Falsigemmobacter faecalis TaxID=2488730 RepID=A0A3P3DQ45_9RHOB|nr:aminoacyl-tRNA hydrolase [Falsigemmobacter faecalis]RRH76383.1 aminoacyl-tRNA hydrolase [Falsigemmobacter faecalis]
MLIWAGLGNPGTKYAGNRHNIGFMALDRMAQDHGFSPWKRAFQGLISEGRLGGEKILLVKPETFMNLSGQSVGEAMRFHKLTPAELTVFHDELDIAPGKVRLKEGGGHAGHNGLRSIHQHVGEAYARVRLGIGHPGHKDKVASYVLNDFAKAEQDWLDDMLRGISEGAADLAAGEGAKFLNKIALRVAPPRSSTGTEGPKVPRAKPEAAGGARPPRAKSEPGEKTVAAPAASEDDTRSALQKLADRFR